MINPRINPEFAKRSRQRVRVSRYLRRSILNPSRLTESPLNHFPADRSRTYPQLLGQQEACGSGGRLATEFSSQFLLGQLHELHAQHRSG